MPGDISMRVESRELQQLSRRLRAQAGGRAQRRYQRAVEGAARPIVPQLRAAALGANVESSRGGSAPPLGGSRSRRAQRPLRVRIAGAIGVRRTRHGARIAVDAARVDARYGGSLPRYLDGTLPGWQRWRHPVFGGQTWTTQTGTDGWFFGPINANAGRVERAVLRAMDDVADDITR